MAVRMDRKQPRREDLTGEPVLVIGAGPAGLASAAELGRLGIPARIVERSDTVASSWRNRYDRLRLNTCRWNAVLRFGDRYEPGTPFFPERDQAVRYLESFAARHGVKVEFGVNVERIDPGADGWQVSTSAGQLTARQVVVATGHQRQPRIPDWPGRDRFPGRIVHSWHYRNPDEFRGLDVLVVGSGCSGLDIATDLAKGGAGRVRVAARTSPNLLLKMSCGLPTDLLQAGLYRVPTRIADPVARIVQRLTVGDLSQWGLPRPETGIVSGLHGMGEAPHIVGSDVIAAIRAREFEIVRGVSSLDADGVRLDDGTTLQPDAIVAATGYTTGLDTMVGHLGVLDDKAQPLNYREPPIRPGLHFVGYATCMGVIGRDAIRVMRHVHAERSSFAAARPEVARVA